MRICMVAHHCCIRVWKIAQMLIEEGHDVALITERIHGYGVNMWNSIGVYTDSVQLINQVKAYDAAGYEVFHVHNEPDWIVTSVRSATKKPVIFDIHDLESARLVTGVTVEEMNLFRSVDGIIHVSNSMKKYADTLHNPECPVEVIFTYTPERFLLPEDKLMNTPRIPHSIVYEGGATEPFSEPIDTNSFNGRDKIVLRSFRDFGHVFKCLVDAGQDMYLYPCELSHAMRLYGVVGCKLHKPIVIEQLIPEMSRYEWGFVGASYKIPLLDKAMPNKLFETMAAGCVPVVYCADEAEKWVLENGFGVVLDTLDKDEIQSKLIDPRKYRQNFLERRHEFTMEAQYDKLMNLYTEAIKYNVTKKIRALI